MTKRDSSIAEQDGRIEETLTTQVYRRLRKDLVAGLIEPGAKLKIQVLADSYGVGPSSVREALSSLVSEGWVERIDQRGFRAASATIEDLVDQTLARIEVDSAAIRLAMEAGDQAWEDEIVVARFRLSKIEQTEEAVSHPDYLAAHERFHRALMAACPSRELLKIADGLRERSVRFRSMVQSRGYVGRDPMGEHDALMDAVLRRDNEAARQNIVAHLRPTLDLLKDLFPSANVNVYPLKRDSSA